MKFNDVFVIILVIVLSVLSSNAHSSAPQKDEVPQKHSKSIIKNNFENISQLIRMLSALMVGLNNAVQLWLNLHK